jgi:hypothetical protein
VGQVVEEQQQQLLVLLQMPLPTGLEEAGELLQLRLLPQSEVRVGAGQSVLLPPVEHPQLHA